MDEPQVGPTVVMLTLSSCDLGTALAGVVVVVEGVEEVLEALVGVVAGFAGVVVGGGAGACAAVSTVMALTTFVLTAFCWAWESRLMSDCTVRVCLPPDPNSSTVGLISPVPFMASAAWD